MSCMSTETALQIRQSYRLLVADLPATSTPNDCDKVSLRGRQHLSLAPETLAANLNSCYVLDRLMTSSSTEIADTKANQRATTNGTEFHVFTTHARLVRDRDLTVRRMASPPRPIRIGLIHLRRRNKSKRRPYRKKRRRKRKRPHPWSQMRLMRPLKRRPKRRSPWASPTPSSIPIRDIATTAASASTVAAVGEACPTTISRPIPQGGDTEVHRQPDRWRPVDLSAGATRRQVVSIADAPNGRD